METRLRRFTYQCEEGTQESDGAEDGDVAMHVRVLVFREQGIVALDPTAFHVLVPTCLDVSFDKGSLTLS